MTGWTVLWRGVRYRAGRSLVVLLLATVATTAAAVLPSYVRAAQQSVLRDLVLSASPAETALQVTIPTRPGGATPVRLASAKSALAGSVAMYPQVQSRVSGTVGQADAKLSLANAPDGTIVDGRLAFRDGICDQVLVTGRCPSADDEVMVSARTAEQHKMKIGDTLELAVGDVPGPAAKPKVVGLYTPKDIMSPYWTGSGILGGGSEPAILQSGVAVYSIDSVIVANPVPIEAARGNIHKTVTYWLNLETLDLDAMRLLQADLDGLATTLTSQEFNLNSGLTVILQQVQRDQDAIAKTVPLGAVPLLVLALFVLMVLVTALAEERGPEIALAKLHGYSSGRVGQFGLGEVLFLIVMAAPAGLLLSWLVMLALKLAWLAPGTPLELLWQPFAWVGGALAVTFVSAIVASRRIFATRIIQLLRRIPPRATWHAGAMEGAVMALALAALVAAWQDRGSGLGLVAAPLLAIVAGIVGGRVLSRVASARIRRARRSANVSSLLTYTQLSRRPGRQRMMVVIAVATSLIGFAATAWDVASQARTTAANAELGAPQVYQATAASAESLLSAVTSAVPDGSAMAVARRDEFYNGSTVRVVAVQSERLAKVATWDGHSSGDLGNAAAKLRPPVAEAYPVSGKLTVQVDVEDFSAVPLELEAQVNLPSGASKTVSLGVLKSGVTEYTATVPSGLLIALNLVRRPGDPGVAKGHLTVRSLSSASGPLIVGGERNWQVGTTAEIKAGLSGVDQLEIDVEATGNRDVHIVHLRTPKALPVLLTGDLPAVNNKPGAPWTFPALGNETQAFDVAQTERSLPGAGTGSGFLTDFDYSLRSALDASGVDAARVRFEVWAAPNAPQNLVRLLADHGVQLYSPKSLNAYSDQLGRRAPALALRIYGLAGLVAILLALGIVVLVARIGAEQRAYELAALRVAGVRERVLRRSLRREYLTLLGWPSLLGFAAGIGSSLFMLPAIPLVTVGVTTAIHWRPEAGALLALAVGCVGCLLVALPISARLVGEAKPDLLRGEA